MKLIGCGRELPSFRAVPDDDVLLIGEPLEPFLEKFFFTHPSDDLPRATIKTYPPALSVIVYRDIPFLLLHNPPLAEGEPVYCYFPPHTTKKKYTALRHKTIGDAFANAFYISTGVNPSAFFAQRKTIFLRRTASFLKSSGMQLDELILLAFYQKFDWTYSGFPTCGIFMSDYFYESSKRAAQYMDKALSFVSRVYKSTGVFLLPGSPQVISVVRRLDHPESLLEFLKRQGQFTEEDLPWICSKFGTSQIPIFSL